MSAGPSQIIPIGQLTRARSDQAASATPGTTTATTRPAGDADAIADGSNPRVYVETYGCQMNVADTDLLSGLLIDAGYRPTTQADQADVILINTCAVREKAEDKVYARARELGSLKKRRPELVLGIAGCMAEHLKEQLLKQAPHVDIVAGPDSYRRMPGLIDQAREIRSRGNAKANRSAGLLDVQLDKSETYEGLSGAVGGDGVSGFITIQRGCDKFCSFCVVPFTRGRERGTAPREVLRQTRAFVDAGYKEVVLLGQTVNSYRYEDVSFAQLLRAVAAIDGIERVRFTSPYPIDFTSDVIDTIAEVDAVCPYVHLPVQSGSDAVLTSMRRGYTVDDFRAIVSELRAKVPDISISSDILCGFSGETEEDHAQTLAMMREIRFDNAFMFRYSERSLTYAAKKQPDDIPESVKKRRLREIITLQEQISIETFQAQVGKRERVLIHSRSKRRNDQLVGRTPGFKSVIVPAAGLEIASFVDVEIERATMATLFGRPL